METQLIADSGATKCEWALLQNGKKKKFITQGISPYFLSKEQIAELFRKELLPKLKGISVNKVHFYGTGLANPENVKAVKWAFKQVLTEATVNAYTDLLAAARALCNNEKGMACILGTGSNSCYYNGKSIVKSSPSLGYILGDEGSGAYLGKRVIQYYLYNTFDEDLKSRFDARFTTTPIEILENVYKMPLANRYLASFAIFLAENRGHYMIENIIEDTLNDFFYTHLCKYKESWTHPINFIGGVAYGCRDVIKDLCSSYELELGKVMAKPIEGLITFHSEKE